MSAEIEKKRLTDFLKEQTAAHGAAKQGGALCYDRHHGQHRHSGAEGSRRVRESQRWMPRPMRTPDAIRQQRVRRRHRLGLRMVLVEISEEAVELLEKRGYVPRRDKVSIGHAVTALLSDRGRVASRPCRLLKEFDARGSDRKTKMPPWGHFFKISANCR